MAVTYRRPKLANYRGGIPTPAPFLPPAESVFDRKAGTGREIVRGVPHPDAWRSGAWTYGDLLSRRIAPPRPGPTVSPTGAERYVRQSPIESRDTRGFERLQYGPPPHYGVYLPPWVAQGPLGERHYRHPDHSMQLPPPPDQGAGGLAGGGYGAPGATEPVPITWSEFDYRPRTAPDWWKAMKPSEIDQHSEYLSSVNMMIPFLSPEDQLTVASQIYMADPENFGHLNPEKIAPPGKRPPMEPRDRHERAFFGSTQRANEALQALTKLREATGKEETDFGPGYHFLRTLATTVGRYGSAGVHTDKVPDLMTRQGALSMMGALDPLLGMGRSEPISAYGPAAQAFGSPFFSRRELFPMMQTEEGRYIFGRPNPLFRF